MKIVILIENTCRDNGCESEHGLSVYVETEKHHLIVDSGASEKAWHNAKKLGVDLKKVDALILSHGHYDHSGGILSFREINPTAPIYMQRSATKAYYHDERYIGIDPKIVDLKQIHLMDGDFTLDEDISVFSGIQGRRYWPQSNLVLSLLEDGKQKQDIFDHEECVVIHSEGKSILISGCAHNGILNIMDAYKERYNDVPDYVITGFHMMKKTDYTEEEIHVVEETARELAKTRTIFYSGHCTGGKAMRLMKPIMGEGLVSLYSGMEIII